MFGFRRGWDVALVAHDTANAGLVARELASHGRPASDFPAPRRPLASERDRNLQGISEQGVIPAQAGIQFSCKALKRAGFQPALE
jgi:hypothetical protein